MEGVPPGPEVIRLIREQSDTVMLAFSSGKDAVAAWLAMRDHRPAFKRIVPFYLYAVPGLEFIEKSLRYYEAFFGTRIIRMPQPWLYNALASNVYQPPCHRPIIKAARMAGVTREDVRRAIREDEGLPEDTWYASGVRASDSPIRRVHFKKHGAMVESSRVFYPVWDLRKDGLVDSLRESGVKMSADYRLFGRSFDGIDYRFLKPIHDHFPNDYRRILEFFPMAGLEIKRAEWAREASRG